MTIQREHDNTSAAAPNSAVKESAWRTASNLLFALTVINVGAVMLTASTFSTLFMITTIVNITLALGLRQMQSWGRILTLARCLLGIALALALAVNQGAVLDAIVTALLLTGIGLPILGPPHKAKSLIGVGLFTLGGAATVVALLSSWVTVG